jgi:hypothetical protein
MLGGSVPSGSHRPSQRLEAWIFVWYRKLLDEKKAATMDQYQQLLAALSGRQHPLQSMTVQGPYGQNAMMDPKTGIMMKALMGPTMYGQNMLVNPDGSPAQVPSPPSP